MREAGVADDRRRARRRAGAGRLLGGARRRGAGAQALPLRAALRLPALEPVREEAERVVANLAAAYRADPALLPDGWRHGGDESQQLRTIGDFIAGMTDRFAIARHEELVGPVDLARRPLLSA